nr:MAG TPA: helicase [Caudoviricetes sp.]
MGFGDIFKATENKKLKEENEKLNSLLTPELLDVKAAQERLEQINQEASDAEKLRDSYLTDVEKIKDEIKQKQSELVQLNDEVLFQSFGLYKPQYDFCNSEEYKNRLEIIRQKQKDMIRADTAVTGSADWSVNGDKRKGQKMVNDMKKLLLRAFNGECDELVSKVKYNNFDSYKKRINTSYEAISKLGKIMSVSITPTYLKFKLDELTLAFEYAQKKQEEKEAQKALREQMREEARLQKEIEEQRKKLEKEQNHYANALERINVQLQSDPDNSDLIAKKQELEAQALDIEKAIKDVDYREANKRAGYVYVISNIGAFGENVYKIGMTRRLDPMDRVDELGDASVPFNFDVHAMIFTDDAPTLEAALHRAFEDRKLNMVNQRREFFNVTLDEIKAVVRANYDKTVEFVDIPSAEQYRVSLKMKQNSTV